MNKQTESSYNPFYRYDGEAFSSAVETFLKNGGDVNGSYNYDKFSYWKQTPLYFAVKASSVRAVQLLLDAGADPNKTMESDITPLHITCRTSGRDAVEIALLLLDHGADLLAEDHAGCSPLHHAFYARKSTLVELLLTRLPRGCNPTDSRNLSAFHIACAHGVDWVVRDLLDSGVPINHYTENTWLQVRLNGLQFAIMDNRKSTVELLLARDAYVNGASASGEMLLHLACECNVEKFAVSSNGLSVEICKDMEKSKQNHLGIINLLLDHGVDVNATDKDGLTPLLYSCTYQDTSTIAWRNSLMFLDDHSMSSMNELIVERRRRIVECLLERGAAIDSRSPDGRSLLHLLFERTFIRNVANDAEMMDLFVKYGADVNARDARHYTPLHAILDRPLYFNNPLYAFTAAENIKLLLKHGADVNARTVEGLTPVALLAKSYGGWKEQLGKCGYLKILLVHTQRLVSLGVSVDDDMREFLREGLDLGLLGSVDKECADELTRMKHVRIEDTSLHRLLRTGLDEAGECLSEARLQEAMRDLRISEEYPHYADLFVLRIRRGQLLKRAEPAMKLIARCELPHLCTDVIFKYLINFDLKNLADIANDKTKPDGTEIEHMQKKERL